MADFQKAKAKILNVEGGYVNNPSDAGGETYRGIARNKNPDWSGWNLIDALKLQANFPHSLDADSDLQNLIDVFYKKLYWDCCLLDDVIYQGVADEILDISVNMGSGIAAHITQHALNLMNRNGKTYADILEDGKIGKMTLMLINGTKNFQALMKALNVLQGARYVKICETDPTQEEFFVGWIMNRC